MHIKSKSKDLSLEMSCSNTAFHLLWSFFSFSGDGFIFVKHKKESNLEEIKLIFKRL